MILSREEMVPKQIEIDLNSPAGNAFSLLGLAGQLGTSLGMSRKKIKLIQDEMMLSSYDMLIETLDKYFGEHVVIYKWS